MQHDSLVALSSGSFYIAREEYQKASAVLDFRLRQEPKDVGAMALRAYCQFKRGDIASAERLLNAAIQIDPRHPLPILYHTKILLEQNQNTRQNLLKLQSLIDSDYYYTNELCDLAMNVAFPGEDYYQILKTIQDLIRPAAYVEIGVCKGLSIQYATHSDIVLGVDVEQHEFQVEAPPNLRMFYKTSNQFFKEDIAESLKQKKVDFTFIDGLHTYEQTLLDFIQIEKYCHKLSIAAFHDCLPLTKGIAQRETPNSFWIGWCGDVWKILPILKKYRPDLTLTMVGAAPSGLLLVQGLDPDSRVLADNFHKIRQEFDPLEYTQDFFERNLAGSLPASSDSVRSLLADHGPSHTAG